MISIQRIRQELRDLLELVLIPGLAIFLPWRICFLLFKYIAHWPWLYSAACNDALYHAKLRGQVTPAEETHWLWVRRLVTLVDHADFYLAKTRSDRFMASHLEVDGNWPSPDKSGIFMSFHWGAGMWGLRHAKKSHLNFLGLVASLDKAYFKGRTVLYIYAQARTNCVAKALGQEPIEIEKSFKPIINTLRNNGHVSGVVDVPADNVEQVIHIKLRGMPAAVPRGLFRLAVDMNIPVTIYLTGFDLITGRRKLMIRSVDGGDNPNNLAAKVFYFLDEAVEKNNAFWHFWSQSERFFLKTENYEGDKNE